MRKFLLPIINLINVVLVSIVFGLGGEMSYTYANKNGQDWYNTVWFPISEGRVNVLGIVGFFLFVVAVAAILVAFFPAKFRKWLNIVIGLALIASGVLFLLTPNGGLRDFRVEVELTDALIAMSVLVFVAGALSLGMAALELAPAKKEAK